MAEEFDGAPSGGEKKGMPSWVWIAGGGDLLLILLLGNKGKSSSTTGSDNLLAAELDAALKDMATKMEQDEAAYKADEKAAWDDFKASIDDLLNQQQGSVQPPGQGIIFDPSGKYYYDFKNGKWLQIPVPPGNPSERLLGAERDREYHLANPGGSSETRDGFTILHQQGQGQGTPGLIPGEVEGAVLDHHVLGFNYRKAAAGG